MEEIKVTWGFAWALWWRMMLIGLAFSAVIWLIMFLVAGATLLPFLGVLGGS